MHPISRFIHLIGKQGITLRGQREEMDDSKPGNNPGSFLPALTTRAFIRAVSKRCHISYLNQSKWDDWHYWKEYHPSNTFRWSKQNWNAVASAILREAPNSDVTQCCSHNLNLSLATSCNLATIYNILEVYKSITIHFNSDPKKEKLLENIVITRCESIGRRKVLVGMCKTCWSERDVSHEHF